MSINGGQSTFFELFTWFWWFVPAVLTEINKFWSYKKSSIYQDNYENFEQKWEFGFYASSRFDWASEGLQPQASGNAKAYSFCKSWRAFLEHPDTGGHSFESWTYYKIKNSNIQIQEAPV